MADRLIDFAIRMLNATLAGFAAFALFAGRRSWRLMRSFGVTFEGYNTGLLVVVVVAAAVGFFWGHKLWRSSYPWTQRRSK